MQKQQQPLPELEAEIIRIATKNDLSFAINFTPGSGYGITLYGNLFTDDYYHREGFTFSLDEIKQALFDLIKYYEEGGRFDEDDLIEDAELITTHEGIYKE